MGAAAHEQQAAHGNQLGWTIMPQMTIQDTKERVCAQGGCLTLGQMDKPLFLIEKLKKTKSLYFWNEKHLQHQIGSKPGAKMPLVTGQSTDKRILALAK